MEQLQNLIFNVREKLSTMEYVDIMNRLHQIYQKHKIVSSMEIKFSFLFLPPETENDPQRGVFSFPHRDKHNHFIYPRFLYQGRGDTCWKWKCIEPHVDLQHMIGLTRHSTILSDSILSLTMEDMLLFQPQVSPCSVVCRQMISNCRLCSPTDHYIISMRESSSEHIVPLWTEIDSSLFSWFFSPIHRDIVETSSEPYLDRRNIKTITFRIKNTHIFPSRFNKHDRMIETNKQNNLEYMNYVMDVCRHQLVPMIKRHFDETVSTEKTLSIGISTECQIGDERSTKRTVSFPTEPTDVSMQVIQQKSTIDSQLCYLLNGNLELIQQYLFGRSSYIEQHEALHLHVESLEHIETD